MRLLDDFDITVEFTFPNGANIGTQSFAFNFHNDGLKKSHNYWMSGRWETRADHDFQKILNYMTWSGIFGNFRAMDNGVWRIWSYAHNSSGHIPDVNNIQLHSMSLWDAPHSAFDQKQTKGKGRIIRPKNPMGKALNVRWWVTS